MIDLWPLLLPAAAWSGWWVANRNFMARSSGTHVNRLSQEYVTGLNYLLNEQPDKAVDVFIKLLEVDSDTVDTHLALGNLFRRRGEVDRSIRIHQNLIARPQLSLLERKQALIALAHDYLSAGVFDRAERIFLEVLALGSNNEIMSLKGLLDIYQQEKAWEKALGIINQLEAATAQSLHYKTAHYHCEIAAQSIKEGAYEKAQTVIRKALAIDKLSVRASLMLASLQMQLGNYKQAIKTFKKVPQQDPEFLSEIVEPLVTCYRQLGTMQDCIQFLNQMLIDHPRTSIIFVIAEELAQVKGLDVAIDFLSDKLRAHPSIRGLNKLIYWHLDTTYGKVREKLEMLHDITTKFLENKPVYRCCHCGFGGKHLHWHCPSCKQWGKMKPVHGLEGD